MTDWQSLIAEARSREYLTVPQLAALLQYDTETVYRMIRDGKVDGVVKTGRSIRIHKATALKLRGPVPPRR